MLDPKPIASATATLATRELSHEDIARLLCELCVGAYEIGFAEARAELFAQARATIAAQDAISKART